MRGLYQGWVFQLSAKIIFFCIIMAGITSIGSAIDVDGPVVITAPGLYYLNTDIQNNTTSTVIDIQSSDVIFDGLGHMIDGVSTAGTFGIQAGDIDQVIVRNVTVQDFGTGMKYLNTSHSYLQNSTLRNNTVGVELELCDNIQVTGDSIEDNAGYGVLFLNTGSNTIDTSFVTNNTNTGIQFSGSSSNTINNSMILANGIDGINLLAGSNNNTLINDIVSLNGENGLFVDGSNNSTLMQNTISCNGNTGLYINQSQANSIADNLFNNIQNANLSAVMYSNTWNLTNRTGPNIVDGPFIGGNFWADPNGTGYSEICNDTDGNGFCDLPYSLATDNTDSLPLYSGQQITHIITASAGSGGTITPSGEVSVIDGENQTFNTSSRLGMTIDELIVDNQSQGAVRSYTFYNVTADHTITATFKVVYPQFWIINATAGIGGSIDPSGEVFVFDGHNKTFNVTALSCFNITDVIINNTENLGAQTSPFQFNFTNVSSNQSIEAEFALIQYPITASAGTGGTITPSGVVNVSCGADQQFSISPYQNYNITSVMVDDQDQGALRNYTFTDVQTSHRISANFTQIIKTYDINATSDPYTIISPHGLLTYPEGENKTFITQAKPGSDLLNVSVDNETYGSIGSWTFTNITRDHNISTTGQYTPGQVQVLFRANQSWGPAPMAVQFTDQSAGSPTSFYWQFGDGLTSTDQNPVHLYGTPGIYSVTLRAINNQTGGVGIWYNGITVTGGDIPQPTPTPVPGPITVAFNATPVSGISPLYVSYLDQSTGNPVSWTWDFGDGYISVQQNPSHWYISPGSYSVTLLAQNDDYSGSLTKPGYIEVS